MFDILGYLFSIVMGFSLGLLGGGGSILTVPIFVYVFGISAESATGYSLFVVGATSLVGFLTYLKSKTVDVRTGFIFALPTLVVVYLVRRFWLPSWPSQFELGALHLAKDTTILVLFSITMLLAASSMIRGRSVKPEGASANGVLFLSLLGMGTGLLTGIIGAGGGFIIIPALVILAGLDTKVAIGTSLMIITINALSGFVGEIQTRTHIDWAFLLVFYFFALVGLFGGVFVSWKMDSRQLKPLFGWFVVIIGVGILIKELKVYF